MTNDILTVADIRTFLADLELSHFERYLNMPPEYCKKMSDCAGTEMSLEEQLKQPWATGIKKPLKVGNPSEYSRHINQIHFEDGYHVRWAEWHGYEVLCCGNRIGSSLSIESAINVVKEHTEARCLEDIKAARTAWEAEQKRKQAPEHIRVYLTYRKALNGVYTLDRGSSNALSPGLITHPKIMAEMPTYLNGDVLL